MGHRNVDRNIDKAFSKSTASKVKAVCNLWPGNLLGWRGNSLYAWLQCSAPTTPISKVRKTSA